MKLFAYFNCVDKNFYDNDNIWTRAEWDSVNNDGAALDAYYRLENFTSKTKFLFFIKKLTNFTKNYNYTL